MTFLFLDNCVAFFWGGGICLILKEHSISKLTCVSGKENSLETNWIDEGSPSQQHQQHQQQQQQPQQQPQQQHNQHWVQPPPPLRSKPDVGDNNNALVFQQQQPYHGTSSATVADGRPTVRDTAAGPATAPATVVPAVGNGAGDAASNSPKRGDAPEELVPAHGAFFFALGCGSALIVTLVAVTSALAYKRTNKSLLRTKSKESLQ